MVPFTPTAENNRKKKAYFFEFMRKLRNYNKKLIKFKYKENYKDFKKFIHGYVDR